MENNLITIDTSKLILAKDKAGQILLTKEAEIELSKVLEFRKLAEDIYEYVQQKLSENMSSQNIKKVVAGSIVVTQRVFGERYLVTEDANQQYTKEVKYLKANAEEIDKYMENNKELPKGVKLKDRSTTVSIIRREEE